MESSVRKLLYVVPRNFDGKYLKDFLAAQGFSQELIKHTKKTLGLDMFHILSAGEEIRIDIIEDESSDIEPNPNLKYEILYEDEDMIVVNKPADMPIHPSQGNHLNTLGNALAAHFNNRNFVYRPITRLDRDTSGVCLIAKNKFSAAIFSEHIAKNLIKRSYLGVVKGNVYNALHINPNLKSIEHLNDLTDLELVIDSPVKRVDDSTIERCVAPDGEMAITKVFAIRYIEKYDVSLCKFILLTGRTHQIRVHMKHIGFPIIGDFLYNPDYTLIKRQALHSSELLMNHPISHEMMRFDAKIPDDINEIIR